MICLSISYLKWSGPFGLLEIKLNSITNLFRYRIILYYYISLSLWTNIFSKKSIWFQKLQRFLRVAFRCVPGGANLTAFGKRLRGKAEPPISVPRWIWPIFAPGLFSRLTLKTIAMDSRRLSRTVRLRSARFRRGMFIWTSTSICWNSGIFRRTACKESVSWEVRRTGMSSLLPWTWPRRQWLCQKVY